MVTHNALVQLYSSNFLITGAKRLIAQHPTLIIITTLHSAIQEWKRTESLIADALNITLEEKRQFIGAGSRSVIQQEVTKPAVTGQF